MDKRIKFILEYFDFESMNRIMKADGWTWWNTMPYTPSVEQLRAEAERLLLNCLPYEGSYFSTMTGGLEADIRGNVLTLRFVPCKRSSDNERELYGDIDSSIAEGGIDGTELPI